MLKKIEVKGLFGAFHHPLTLKKQNITLMLGENGLGKTIILKMIKAFFDKDFFELKSNLFTEFILVFNDENKIVIKKKESKEGSSLIFRFFAKGKRKPQSYTMNFSEQDDRHGRLKQRKAEFYFRELRHELRHYLPDPIEQIGVDTWMDHSRNITYTTKELFDRYSRFFPPHLRKQFDESVPEWLIKITESLKTKLIETQRLLIRIKAQEGEYRSSVVRYSQELVETIKNKTVAATDLASKLDRSYPNRVINITQTTKITDRELEDGLADLNSRRELLNRVGLIDTQEETLQPITNAIKHSGKNKGLLKDVLQIYLQDSNEKLTIYDELAKRIDLLIGIINKRFLFKKLTIDKIQGFVFTSSITGKAIPLSGLSSGEQHELVLFFQLLFNTEPNSLLLIDEPEISLHISWQNQFINDLKDVIELNNLSAIIATHSPDIINNNWDLTIELKGV